MPFHFSTKTEINCINHDHVIASIFQMHLTIFDESRWSNFKCPKVGFKKPMREIADTANSLILLMRLDDPNKDNNQNEVAFLRTRRYLPLRK